MLQQTLQNQLNSMGIDKDVYTIITQVVVDSGDPAFKNPTKPIGPFYSREEAERIAREKGWTIIEDSGRGYRRVVPSPEPVAIVERRAIERAIDTLRRFNGIVDQASEQELTEAVAQADRTGLFNCPHTGVALAVLKKLIARGIIRRADRVVVVSTAHGLKFTDFKVRYHELALEGIDSRLANPPIELPARYEEVRDEMLRQIDRRFGS